MTAVSLRQHAQERLEEGRAAIPQAPRHPVPIERLQCLHWREFYTWRETPPLSFMQRLRIRHNEKRQQLLSQLVERLKLAGERIRVEQERNEQLERQRIEIAQRRVERSKTHLGRLANRLEAKGYKPDWKR